MKYFNIKMTAIAGSFALTMASADATQFVFVVDESGSMFGEHQFLETFVPQLDTSLGGTNTFGLVGFGSDGAGIGGRVISVGGTNLGTATDFATATGSLVTNGFTEDGYSGVQFALDNYTFDPNQPIGIVLVTDEDRDILQLTQQITAATIEANLRANQVVFSTILDQSITAPDGTTGIAATTTQTFTDGNGDGVPETSGTPTFTNASGTTFVDYTQLSLNLAGCVADLNQLRQGGTVGQAFATIFNNCLQQVTVNPTPTAAINPYIIYGARDSMFGIAKSFANGASIRLTGQSYGHDQLDTSVFNADSDSTEGGSSQFEWGQVKGFVSASMTRADYDYDRAYDSHEISSYSGIAGLDYTFAPNVFAGVMLGIHRANSDNDRIRDSIDSDAYSVGIYGSAAIGERGFIDGIASYTFGDVDTKRVTSGGIALGNTDTDTWGAQITAGIHYQYNLFDLTPSVEVGHINVDIDGFTESGPGAVSWDDTDAHMTWATPQIDVSRSIEMDNYIFTPSAGIGARFKWGDEGVAEAFTLGGGATPVNAGRFALPEIFDTAAVVRAGLGFSNPEKSRTFRIGYEGEFSSDLTSHTLTARIRIAF